MGYTASSLWPCQKHFLKPYRYSVGFTGVNDTKDSELNKVRKTVLLIEPTILTKGVDFLKTRHRIVVAPDGEDATLIRWAREHRVNAIIPRVETITGNVIDACPTLEVVGQPGVGVDNIDVAACTRRGVRVVHAPEGNFVSVAEHTLAFILALGRDLVVWDRRVRKDEWGLRNVHLPMEVQAKTLFIIGLGRSGREVARMARALHMTVLGFARSLSRDHMAELGVEKVDALNDGLARADFTSLHVPLTPETRHMISHRAIQAMKKGSFLINLSRGMVVDPEALYRGLNSGHLAGAALDVMDPEPPPADDPLLSLENVIVTPHLAGDTLEAKKRCVMTMVGEVDKVLGGRTPRFIANPEVLDRPVDAADAT